VSTQAMQAARKRPRAIHLQHSLVIARPPAQVFRFITHQVPERYPELARGHERFRVLDGGPVREGAVIDCRERVEQQEVHHRYQVRAFEQDRHLHYASEPSRTFIHLKHRVLEGVSDTQVYYDLDAHPEGTRLDMWIVIQFPRLHQKWLALATGTARLWGAHQQEELARVKQLVEEGGAA
jgi:hypothetical protein